MTIDAYTRYEFLMLHPYQIFKINGDVLCHPCQIPKI